MLRPTVFLHGGWRCNRYFEIGHLMILALAPRLSTAGRIAHWLKIPHLRFGSFGHHYRLLRRRFEPLDDELSYRATALCPPIDPSMRT